MPVADEWTRQQATSRRPYQRHGLYTLQAKLKAADDQDTGLESLGPLGVELKAWQADLMADLGGAAAISTQQRALIELCVRTRLLLESVDRFLLEQPSLVNKSKRQLFPVVLQRQTLADALARYLGQLGLQRRVTPTSPLEDYLQTRYGRQDESRPQDAHPRWPEDSHPQTGRPDPDQP